MPLAATVVVALYVAGVIARGSTQWYEWLAALAGGAFAAWFWIAEYQRMVRRRGKGR